MSENFKELISQNKKITIVTYSVDNEIEKKVRYILKLILEKYECLELHIFIYTCLKELVLNAVKANFKNIFFEDYKSVGKPDRALSYYKALQVFKLEMSREEASYLGELARRSNLFAEIHFEVKNNNLAMSVVNPLPMTKIEKDNVIRKLNESRKFNDIIEYYKILEKDPHKEGAGLGLVLITQMLQSLGIPVDNPCYRFR